MKDWGLHAAQQWPWAWSLVALLVLYLFRPRHRPQKVPANFLWREVDDRMGGQSLWRRLQHNRLFWLQFLFLILTILALLRPYQIRPGLVSRQVVLLIDTSASMSTLDRFPKVLDEARRIVQQAPSGSEFLLATLDHQLQLLQPFTRDRVVVLRQISQLQVRASRGDDALAAPFFLSLLKSHPQSQLHWFSDHSLKGLPQIDHLATQGQINYAIESFQVTPDSLFLALKNHHSQAAQLRLQVRGPAGFFQERNCQLKARGRQLVHIRAPLQPGVFQASILTADDMPLDSQAWSVSQSPSRGRLVAHGQLSPFLEQAATAATGLPLIRPQGDLQVAGIHLWDRLPSKKPEGVHVALLPPKDWVEGPPIEDEGPLRLHPDRSSEYQFDLHSRRWGTRWKLKPGLPDLEVLAETLQGEPLIVSQNQALVFLFALEASELPLSPELPMLMSAWLQQHRDPWESLNNLLCQSRVQLPLAGAQTLQGPQGRETVEGHWTPSWPGLYQLGERQLAVHFFAPEESNLQPPAPTNPTAQAPLTPDQLARTRPMSREIGLGLVFLALVVLCLEYFAWRR